MTEKKYKKVKYERGNFFTEGGAAHSSNRHDWGTPQYIYDQLNEEFGFTVDVCASAWNAKHKNYFDKEIDGLKQDWSEHVCFMNPPFGRSIKKWIKKAYEEWQKGAVVVCVMPARTDTIYWHEYIEGEADVRFIRGRLKYERPDGAGDPAPFPSCVVIWN